MIGVATMEDRRFASLGRTALPVVAALSFAAGLGATIAVAGDTLGYDFRAYHAAAVRLLHGQPLYDTSFQAAGGFGLFYYPPTFAPLILPFGWLSETTAVWAWTVILVAAFAAGVAVLPVARTVRWGIVLLAGWSWPFVYAVKLGQVGPILFLLFALGWRSLATPFATGVAAGLGTAIKLQPGLVLVWAALTRRWPTLVAGFVVLVLLALAATLLAGITAWTDFTQLIGRVGDPITTPHNVTPGAIAWQLGASFDMAWSVQWVSIAISLIAVVAAVRWATVEASYLVAVVASQLISPILWDHYALLLLLPVAFLLHHRQRWAVLIPLATSLPLLSLTPPVVYPIVFFASLFGPAVASRRSAS